MTKTKLAHQTSTGLTKNQTKVLLAVAKFEIEQGSGQSALGLRIQTGLKGPALGGVIPSLVKKGLVDNNGVGHTKITEKGLHVARLIWSDRGEQPPASKLVDVSATRCGGCFQIAEANADNEGYSDCCNKRIQYPEEYADRREFRDAVIGGLVTQ